MASARKVVWSLWGINELIALCFGLLSVALWNEIRELNNHIAWADGDFSQGILNGIAATGICVCVLVVVWTVLSGCVLLRATVSKKRSRSFSFAFVLAAGYWTAFHVINAALHFHSVKGFVENLEGRIESGTSYEFESAYLWSALVLGYVSGGLFLVTSITMTFMQSAVQPPELGGKDSFEGTSGGAPSEGGGRRGGGGIGRRGRRGGAPSSNVRRGASRGRRACAIAAAHVSASPPFPSLGTSLHRASLRSPRAHHG